MHSLLTNAKCTHQCTMCTVYSTVNSVLNSAQCTHHCTVYSTVHSVLKGAQFNQQCIVYSTVQSARNSTHYTKKYTLYLTVQSASPQKIVFINLILFEFFLFFGGGLYHKPHTHTSCWRTFSQPVHIV